MGKTSLSTAAALALADAGKKVLLVSTDAASNLDEMLGIELRNIPTPVPGAPGLSVLNIDPDVAAESYRQRVLAQMGTGASDAELHTVREQLSGACTTEIASFDEFASLLSEDAEHFDHLVFDTAPTGHTLRLLSLPRAWSGFLAGNDRGASCLGPHSGLKMQEARFKAALKALSDPVQTTMVLVTRPDKGAIAEAAHTAEELHALGLHNQRLVVNGEFHATARTDAVACAIEALGQQALDDMPDSLRALPQDSVPLRAFDTVGLPALRALLTAPVKPVAPVQAATINTASTLPGLDALANELAAAGRGLIMVMGKGDVGKTTVAAALALGLVQRGKTVHLSTTDPAHIRHATQGTVQFSNTQPFIRELGGRTHVFAHNGDLPGIEAVLSLGAGRPVGQTDSEYAFCVLLGRLQSLWNGAVLPTLDARLSLLAAFAADLRQLGPSNFLYADSDALFAHGHRRLHNGHGHAEPPGLWTLQQHCAPADSPPSRHAGISIAQEERVSLFIASVPLTSEAWQPMPEGELVAVRDGQLIATRAAVVTTATTTAGSALLR